MLEQKTQLLMRRLREQSRLAYNQNTLSGIFYVMYGFVEIIENDPIFSKFIKAKVIEENEIHANINKAYHNKEIDKKQWYDLAKLHVAGKFYNEYYCLFKDAHDSIKRDRCCALGIKADNLMEAGFFELDASDPRFSKHLTKDDANFYISDFEKCLDKITELINSDQKLLIQIYNESEKENPNVSIKEQREINNDDSKNTPDYLYSSSGEIGTIKFKNDSIKFEGRRALILDYFFKTKGQQITHRDFSEWIKLNKIKGVKTGSVSFRQDIEEINERIKKESTFIKLVITKVKKHWKNITEINRYNFEIIYKK